MEKKLAQRSWLIAKICFKRSFSYYWVSWVAVRNYKVKYEFILVERI